MSVTVTLGVERLMLQTGETLLDGLERHGYSLEYQCRKGYCGTCRVRMAEGAVDYPDGKPLAYLSRGEVLACCAVPRGNVLLEEMPADEEEDEQA